MIAGYEFRNPALLEEAFTSPACRMDCPSAKDNQRLEFLGDSVLGMLAAERLYAERPNDREGPLTVMRTHMVSTAALCDAAARIGVVRLLKRNRGAEPLPRYSKTLADAIEALIGAAYVDGGYAAAQTVFDALGLSADANGAAWSENPKGDLQIRTQSMVPPRLPAYEIVSVAGKSHAPVFTVRVSVEGLGEATASASSRHGAETAAASELLKKCS